MIKPIPLRHSRSGFSPAQAMVLRRAAPGYEPARTEMKSVRILMRRGFLRQVQFYPLWVETTDRGRSAIGMRARARKVQLKVIQGGRGTNQ